MTLDNSFLRGSYPPLLTPFRDGAVDFEAYEGLVARQIEAGSHGIVVNGTTGEPSTLTISERNKLVDVAVKASGGQVPVIAATGSQSLEETLELTAAAENAGASAVLVVTPYYIKPPQRGLVEYFSAVGQHTGLPLLLYHIPARAAVSFELDTLDAIAQAVPHFVGIKHSAYDLVFLTRTLAHFGPSFRAFVGVEELTYPMLAVGACGMVNAAANVAPRQIVALYDAVSSGDHATARSLHYELFELNCAVFWDTNPIPVKYMAKRLGIIVENEHRLPMAPAEDDLQTRLDTILERAGLLGAARA